MGKKLIVVLVVMLSVAFAVNRIDNSKSVSSNYLLLATVEKQNIEQINNAIRFNVPSYQYEGIVMNTAPIEVEGKTRAVTGVAVEGSLIKARDFNINNNYGYQLNVEYNNHSKELLIRGVEGFDVEPQIETFSLESLEDGGENTEVNLVIGR